METSVREMLAASVSNLLGQHCSGAQVRRFDAGDAPSALWQAMVDAGLPGALMAEGKGGAGLAMHDVLPVLLALGAHVAPVALAETMLARAFLSNVDQALPDGAVAIGGWATQNNDESMYCAQVPFARTAQWVILAVGETSLLLPVADAQPVCGLMRNSQQGALLWSAAVIKGARRMPWRDWASIGAGLIAVRMAGAMQKMLDMTMEQANTRVQFGRPIGKFQAVQHQISVLAEQVFAVRMAAEMSYGPVGEPSLLWAAIAKARASEAVASVTSIAHAVHGAIGITAEYDLQLLTRRLHEWRLAYGAESYWQAIVGQAVLATPDLDVLDFIRVGLEPVPRPIS